MVFLTQPTPVGTPGNAPNSQYPYPHYPGAVGTYQKIMAQIDMINAVATGKAYWVWSYYGHAPGGLGFGVALNVVYYTQQPSSYQPKSLVSVATSPNLDVSFDAWGSTIPYVEAHVRIMGHVIWAEGMEQGSSVAMPATLSFAVGFAYPLDPLEYQWIEVTKIWANGILVYGGTNDLPGMTFRFRAGSEHETVDPLILADKGASRTPAFRGMRTIVFPNFPIAVVGNTLPQISAEFALTKDAPTPLIKVATVLEQIAAKSDIDLPANAEFDDEVRGVVIMSDLAPVAFARDLMPTYNFFILDGNGASLSRRAVGPGLVIDATLDVTDFVKTDGDIAVFKRVEASEIPNSMEVQYADPTLAFTNGIQYAKRPVFPVRESISQLRDTTQLPFVMDATQALSLAYDRLYRSITEQLSVKFFTSNVKIEVGDVLQINCGDMGSFVTRVKTSVLHFDTQVSNEIEVIALLKKVGVTADTVAADAGDYLTDTVIPALRYPGGFPTGGFIGPQGIFLDIGVSTQILISGGNVWTPYEVYVGVTKTNGYVGVDSSIPFFFPHSHFTEGQNVNPGGQILEDATYVYGLDYGSNALQRINKTTRSDDTAYLDLSASTNDPPENGCQSVIIGNYWYFATKGNNTTGGDPVKIYRLDLSLFASTGLTSINLDSDTNNHSPKGMVAVGNQLFVTTLSYSGSANARLYKIDTAGWATTGGASYTHLVTTSDGALGRGVASGGLAYFVPIESKLTSTSTTWDDEGELFSEPQTTGAKVDPSSFAPGTVYGTFDSGSTTNVTLSGGDLTATHTNASQAGARSATQKSSGKHYFEVAINTVTGVSSSVGILTAAGTYADLSAALNVGAVYAGFGGPIFGNDTFSTKSIGDFSNGDVIGVAADLDNNRIWFRKAPSGDWNGDPGADPATNTNGVDISNYAATTMSPAVGFDGVGTGATENFTANYGASGFTGAVPSGFNSGWLVSTAGGVEFFDITDDPNVNFGSKGNIFPWTDGVNLYYLCNEQRTPPRTGNYLAARKLSDLSVVPGIDLTAFYDKNTYDFFNGATDGNEHFIAGGNTAGGESIGAMLLVAQDLSTAAIQYRGANTAPLNDDFVNATAIGVVTTAREFTNILATRETGEPQINGQDGGASIWLAFTAPATQSYTIDARTSDTQPVYQIGVYTGAAVDALSTVAEGPATSTLTFSATAGVTYFIAFDGQFGGTGTVRVTIQ